MESLLEFLLPFFIPLFYYVNKTVLTECVRYVCCARWVNALWNSGSKSLRFIYGLFNNVVNSAYCSIRNLFFRSAHLIVLCGICKNYLILKLSYIGFNFTPF